MMLAFVMLATSGCVPSYLVRPSELAGAEVPSVRERDGRAVTLEGGSFRVTHDPPLADGRVRVRGPGRHGNMWLGGLIMTSVGIGLGLTAVGLGFAAVAQNDSGDSSNSRPMMTSAVVLGGFGALTGALLGPSVWVAGARQAPIELHY